ncbi:MAG: hypothetical protein K0U98_19520 [Deltaproteobacteria bacterium]|nr:hypothetical protein [Deltaproteobacteria bacterium]
MKHILHLLHFDLLRTKGLLSLWLGALILPLFFLLTREPSFERARLVEPEFPVGGLLILLAAFLIALVFHQHPPSGNSFWLTRPIPPIPMLVSKVSLLFLGMLLPAIAGNLIFGVAQGFEPEQIASNLQEAAVVLFPPIAAACVAAVSTRGLAHFLLLWIVVDVATSWATFPVESASQAVGLGAGSQESWPLGWQQFEVLVVLVSCLLAIAAAYAWRNQKATVLVFLGGSALLSCLSFLPALFPALSSNGICGGAEISTEGLEIFQQRPARFAMHYPGGGKARPLLRSLSLDLESKGSDPATLFQPEFLTAQLSQPNGDSLRLVGRGGSWTGSIPFGKALDIPTQLNGVPSRNLQVQIWARQNLAFSPAEELGELDGSLRLRAFRFRPWLSLPLKQGAQVRNRGSALSLSKVEFGPTRARIRLLQSRPVTHQRNPNSAPTYALVHRARGEALLLSETSTSSQRFHSLKYLAMEVERREVVVEGTLPSGTSIGRDWFQQSELVGLVPSCIGRVEVDLTPQEFQVEPLEETLKQLPVYRGTTEKAAMLRAQG